MGVVDVDKDSVLHMVCSAGLNHSEVALHVGHCDGVVRCDTCSSTMDVKRRSGCLGPLREGVSTVILDLNSLWRLPHGEAFTSPHDFADLIQPRATEFSEAGAQA